MPKSTVSRMLLLPSTLIKSLEDADTEAVQLGEEWTTFHMEVICTFIFVLFILFVSGKHGGGSVWGLPAICLVLWALCTVDAFTGASFNPALAVGSTVFQAWWYPNESHAHRVMYYYLVYYIGGALTGGVVAGVFYNMYEQYVLDPIAAEKAAEAAFIQPTKKHAINDDFDHDADLKNRMR